MEESIPALDELRKAGKTKYIGLSEPSAATLRKAHSSETEPPATLNLKGKQRPLTLRTVAPIDALQAEYSAFETLHETDGLIDTAKELGIAYVAYSPLGHGWLVDDFPFKTPDDFPPNDFRRRGERTYANGPLLSSSWLRRKPAQRRVYLRNAQNIA